MRKLLATAALLALSAVPASAAVVQFTLDNTVEGVSPSGAPVITLEDIAPDTVRLTIDLTDLSGGEFVSNVFLNYTDAPSGITFTIRNDLRTGTFDAPTISQSLDGQDSPGNQGMFDIQLAFTTSNSMGGARRFAADEIAVFDLTALGLMAEDFSVISAPEGPSMGQNFALARVQGIAGGGSASVADSDGDDNEIIDTPTPATVALFGLGLLALGLRRRS